MKLKVQEKEKEGARVYQELSIRWNIFMKMKEAQQISSGTEARGGAKLGLAG